jgi:hypothetical protein
VGEAHAQDKNLPRSLSAQGTRYIFVVWDIINGSWGRSLFLACRCPFLDSSMAKHLCCGDKPFALSELTPQLWGYEFEFASVDDFLKLDILALWCNTTCVSTTIKSTTSKLYFWNILNCSNSVLRLANLHDGNTSGLRSAKTIEDGLWWIGQTWSMHN